MHTATAVAQKSGHPLRIQSRLAMALRLCALSLLILLAIRRLASHGLRADSSQVARAQNIREQLSPVPPTAANPHDLSLATCTVCVAPDPTWFPGWPPKELFDPKVADAMAASSAAAQASKARPSRRKYGKRERMPKGQRVRVRWSEGEYHLGTVYGHKVQQDNGGVWLLMTCIVYDADPAAYRPCHDLSTIDYEPVDSGVFELFPPPPPHPHGPPTILRSCCHDGGSWADHCGVERGREYAWDAGLRACNLKSCPRCGSAKTDTGAVDLNCKLHGCFPKHVPENNPPK